MTAGEPCGAYVVTEWIQGSAATLRWCERTYGPCPYVGADTMHDSNERKRLAGYGEPDDRGARPCAVRAELAVAQ